MPIVSFVIPSFNYAQFLPAAIKSIFSQKIKDFEIIVVDDCSTDNTYEVMQNLLSKKDYQGKLFYIRYSPNKGVSTAINTGIKMVKGKYLVVMPSDDLVLSNFLSDYLPVLEKNQDIAMIFGPVVYINEKGKIIGRQKIFKKNYIGSKNPYMRLTLGNYIYFSTVIMRTDIAKKVNMYHSQLSQYEDWDMWLKVSQNFTVAYSRKALGAYRVHSLGLTAYHDKHVEKITKERSIVYRKTISKHIPFFLKVFSPLIYFDVWIYTFFPGIYTRQIAKISWFLTRCFVFLFREGLSWV